jgi:hypothetical protein
MKVHQCHGFCGEKLHVRGLLYELLGISSCVARVEGKLNKWYFRGCHSAYGDEELDRN